MLVDEGDTDADGSMVHSRAGGIRELTCAGCVAGARMNLALTLRGSLV